LFQHAKICRPRGAMRSVSLEKRVPTPKETVRRGTGREPGGLFARKKGKGLKRQSNTHSQYEDENHSIFHTSYCSPFCRFHTSPYLPNVPVPASHRRLVPSYFLRNAIHYFDHHTLEHQLLQAMCKHDCRQLDNAVRARTSSASRHGGALAARLLQ
jgi:hypothetical protein